MYSNKKKVYILIVVVSLFSFVVFLLNKQINDGESASIISTLGKSHTSNVSDNGSNESALDTQKNNTKEPQNVKIDKSSISQSENEIIINFTDEVKHSFEAIESANSSVVYTKELLISQIQQIKVLPPSLDQLDPIYAGFSRTVKLLNKGSPADIKLRKEFKSLINEYAFYPRPVKILDIVVPTDKSKAAKFLELFVNDESECKPNEEGILTIPRNPEIKGDEDYFGKNSWAQKRYDHLLTIER